MINSKAYIEAHIAKLSVNPVKNANLIRKWERKLRNLERENK